MAGFLGNKGPSLKASVLIVIALYIGVEIFFYMFQSNSTVISVSAPKESKIRCDFTQRNNSFQQNDNESTRKTRVVFIFGTRPEIIKMAPVIQEFERSGRFTVINVFTGQHPDMIQPFLLLFEIKVDVFIRNTMQAGQSLSSLVSNVMKAMEVCLTFHQSDIWMVQGDTSTAFAVSTVAFNHKLRIGHIEAGLRTYDMYSPFPEEFNRKSLASIATFHFAPTEKSKNNLISEGIPSQRIYMTGNTVIDAVKILNKRLPVGLPKMVDKRIKNENIVVLITMHRRENFEVMNDFYRAIDSVPCSHCRFIVPVHPNPNAGKPARAICLRDPVRFICVPPLSYQDLHLVMRRSQFILTDSGGLQEEATWYHKPILVLRKDTERTEAIDAGVAVLIGRNYEKLKNLIPQLLNKTSSIFTEMSKNVFPFGYGNASQQILNVLLSKENDTSRSILVKPKFVSLSNETRISKIDEEAILNNNPIDFSNITVALILQVFKRDTLALQLERAKVQTLKPKTIVVFQNGFHVDVSSSIKKFRDGNPDIEVQHIASSKNARFHGRFHVAYMMEEEYVSVWDDDVSPGEDWTRFCIDYSKRHKNALVGANGRSLHFFNGTIMYQKQYVGRNDFVGHTWTLPRRLLKYFVELKPLTRHTGEDIQLAFALQKVGIEAHMPDKKGTAYVTDLVSVLKDKNSSFQKNQWPRQLLFCKIVKAGFKPLGCLNCDVPGVMDSCIQYFKSKALEVEKQTQQADIDDNNKVVWMAYRNLATNKPVTSTISVSDENETLRPVTSQNGVISQNRTS